MGSVCRNKDSVLKRMDKNTCNKCQKKTSLTGHILCHQCKQWVHLKCIDLNTSEAKLKQAEYKCEACVKKDVKWQQQQK